MEIILLWGAQNDLLEAYRKFGEPLHEKVDRALDLIRENPELAPLYKGQYHRKVVFRSCFALYYTVEGGRIIVGAFLDQRQDPKLIDRRLGLE